MIIRNINRNINPLISLLDLYSHGRRLGRPSISSLLFSSSSTSSTSPVGYRCKGARELLPGYLANEKPIMWDGKKGCINVSIAENR